MEELLKLREFIMAGDLTAALSLIDELEEMSKEDKINKIYSYYIVLYHAIAHYLGSPHWWSADEWEYPLPLSLAKKLKEWCFSQ